MEFNFRSIGHRSDHSSAELKAGDVVISFLYLGENGVAERSDILTEELNEYNLPGKLLCKWKQEIRSKEDGEAELKKAALHSSEEMFLSLFDDENESSESDEEVMASIDRLKFFLALQLERKRVLRSHGSGRYLHIKTKKVYPVKELAITPELLRAIQQEMDRLRLG